MFDLEQSIAEWRRRMLDAGINTPVPLEELESHLREQIERQMEAGLTAQTAFEAAIQQIGQAGELKREFAKVDVTWRVLKQKVVWALIAAEFLICGIVFGGSPALAITYGVLLAGLIVATFIDYKYYIIPDQIAVGGIIAGFFGSLVLPPLHGQIHSIPGMLQSLLGMSVGAGVFYLILRLGKLAFGRQRVPLSRDCKIRFAKNALLLPESEISYDELFHRKSDAIMFHAREVEFAGHSYQNVPIRLTPLSLQIGDDKFAPDAALRMSATTSEINLPREAMGLGDVKFMAAIGAFLGWQAVIFSLLVSSFIGAFVGAGLIILRHREVSSRVPYGPFLAIAAAIWIFGGKHLVEAFLAW